MGQLQQGDVARLQPENVRDDNFGQRLLLTWVYLSNVLAAAVFFGRPTVALWGAVCMGIVLIPWWWRSWSQPQW